MPGFIKNFFCFALPFCRAPVQFFPCPILPIFPHRYTKNRPAGFPAGRSSVSETDTLTKGNRITAATGKPPPCSLIPLVDTPSYKTACRAVLRSNEILSGTSSRQEPTLCVGCAPKRRCGGSVRTKSYSCRKRPAMPGFFIFILPAPAGK